jgi:hypothetical protein
LITLSDKYSKEVGIMTVLQQELEQPQVVIQSDGRVNIIQVATLRLEVALSIEPLLQLV